MFWTILNYTVFMIEIGEKHYLGNFFADVNKVFWKHAGICDRN